MKERKDSPMCFTSLTTLSTFDGSVLPLSRIGLSLDLRWTHLIGFQIG